MFPGVRVALCLTCRLLLLVALAMVASPRGAPAQSLVGDPGIYPKPLPAPGLPAAGQTFVDPMFLTTIVRVTDPVTAPTGAGVNSSASDSMFNADGSLFYLHYQNAGSFIYAV